MPRRLDAQQDRLAARRLGFDLREVELAALLELVKLLRDDSRAERTHHLMILRNDDLTARQLVEEERDSLVEGDAALKENLAARRVEEQLPDRVEDRPRLRLARAGEQIADRHAVLELVDRGRGKDRTDRAELGVGLVVDLVGDVFDLDTQLLRDRIEEAARTRRADAAHHRRPEVHRLVVDHALRVLAAAIDDRIDVRMQELRALDVRRHLAHLKIEGNELPRVLDDLTARHNETRQVIERYARNLEELERQPLDRTAAAMPAAIATPRAGNLA